MDRYKARFFSKMPAVLPKLVFSDLICAASSLSSGRNYLDETKSLISPFLFRIRIIMFQRTAGAEFGLFAQIKGSEPQNKDRICHGHAKRRAVGAGQRGF